MALKRFRKTFGSVRLALALIIAIAAVSVLGTLIPQHRPAADYAARFGNAGKLAGPLGLDRIYQSPLFLGLLLLLAVNLSVCTLDRLPARSRKAFGTGWAAEAGKFESWKIHDSFSLKGSPAEAAEAVASGLRRGHFRVRKAADGPRLLLRGTRNTLGAFGADFVHAGLLVVIAGGIASGLGGFKTEIAVVEGKTEAVGTGGLELRLDRFETDYYPGGAVKDWKSAIALLRSGRTVASGTIEVNHPLRAGGVMFYQSGYGRDWEVPVLGLKLGKKSDPAWKKEISLKPGESAEAGDGITVSALRFVPDFVITEGNKVATRTLEPHNPAALIEIRRGDGKADSAWVFANYPGFAHFGEAGASDLTLELGEYRAPQYSVIMAARDPGAPVIWSGCAVLMAGLFLCFFLPAREIRVSIEPGKGTASSVVAGGRSSKGGEILAREFASIIAGLRRPR